MKRITKIIGITPGINPSSNTKAFFSLADEASKSENLQRDGQEPEIGNYFQMLHLKNHAIISREVVHDLYSEKNELGEVSKKKKSAEDEQFFQETGDAASEKNIVDLRANIQSIAKYTTIFAQHQNEINP